MKKLLTLSFLVAGCLGATLWAQQQDPGLPTVTHDGRPCYFYNVKSGESLYGIRSRFGWNEDTLLAYNPKAANLKKGMLLYYPVPHVPDGHQQLASAIAQTVPSATVEVVTVPTPVAPVHPITVDDPADSVLINGLQQPVRGEVAPVAPMVKQPGFYLNRPFEYTLKQGDTLFALAREYNVKVADIFAWNPGLREQDMRPGMTLKITPAAPDAQYKLMPVSEKVLKDKYQYKIAEGDSWTSLAAKAGVSEEMLRAVNSERDLPGKGKKIWIPVVADTTYFRNVLVTDPREETPAGRGEIYSEVHGLKKGMPLDVTLLTSAQPEAEKRDMEFVRGFLLGLKSMADSQGKISLHVRRADKDSLSLPGMAYDSVLDSSKLIIATYDHDFPEALAKSATERSQTLVNVFDAKSDLYLSYPSVMQMLTPSADFYSDIADFLLQAKSGSKFIFIGEESSEGEVISLQLLERLIRDGGDYETIPSYADLETYAFLPGKSYVVISDANKKATLEKLLASLQTATDNNPSSLVSLVGRPTWLIWSESLKEKLQKADTYLPARFYLDPQEQQVKDFDKAFSQAYGKAPLRSLPSYAAMGYDMARYLLPTLAENGGDTNALESESDLLQIPVSLERPSLWQGMVNGNVYLLHFTPYMTTDKIRL